MAMGKQSSSPKDRTGFWRCLERRLRDFDFWRLVVAFGLALMTWVVIRRQSAESPFAAWREIKQVSIIVEDSAHMGNLYLLPRTYYVDLEVSVDAMHRSTAFQADQFGIEINEQRLMTVLNSRPDNASAEPQEVDYWVVEADVVKKPAGVDIRGIKNGHLKIKCDQIGVREMQVRLKIDPKQEVPGWTYECSSLTSIVRVTGPMYQLARLEPISTEVIMPKETQPYRGLARLVKPLDMPEITLSTEQIEYEVIPQKDSKEIGNREFKRLQIFFLMRGDSMLEPQFDSSESTREVDIHLRGPSKVLKAMTPEDIRVVCDLTPYTMAGKQNVKLRVLNLPEGVQVEEILPRDILTVELGYRRDSQPKAVIAPDPEAGAQ